ncbi:MAG: FAD-binding oxidoreductase, partial [Dehalococcoidia bacterium]|nr:FAD-binding oxidoreductase [Dehalococcoidia bacterium]
MTTSTTSPPQAELSGWGRYPRSRAAVIRPERLSELKLVTGGVIARGLGRSYGDASINGGHSVILTERLNRFISFDAVTGVLRSEAGATMGDVLQTFVPKGWFLPITPGTKFVTLGGAVASDIHGKNHHRDGSFGRFVNELRMLLADGCVVDCSPIKMPELFWATIGGMGLTGVILEVTFRLIPIQTAYIHAKSYYVANLGEALKVLSDPAKDDQYSVCWLNTTCTGALLGQGLVFTGHHAHRNELPSTISNVLVPHRIRPGKQIPLALPLLSGPAVTLFNRWYAWQNNKKDAYISQYDQFFYPLDAIANWNLLYGSRGLLQYQVVVPGVSAESALGGVLKRLQKERLVSFLT